MYHVPVAGGRKPLLSMEAVSVELDGRPMGSVPCGLCRPALRPSTCTCTCARPTAVKAQAQAGLLEALVQVGSSLRLCLCAVTGEARALGHVHVPSRRSPGDRQTSKLDEMANLCRGRGRGRGRGPRRPPRVPAPVHFQNSGRRDLHKQCSQEMSKSNGHDDNGSGTFRCHLSQHGRKVAAFSSSK